MANDNDAAKSKTIEDALTMDMLAHLECAAINEKIGNITQLLMYVESGVSDIRSALSRLEEQHGKLALMRNNGRRLGFGSTVEGKMNCILFATNELMTMDKKMLKTEAEN